MVTIKDIAKLANVSSTTVSRVLNHDKSLMVTEDTRERILQNAKLLGYKTVKERKLKKAKMKKKYSILLLLCLSSEEELMDPYFLSIRKGVESSLVKNGVNSFEVVRIDETIHEHQFMNKDGAIVIGRISDQTLKKLTPNMKNFVYINHSPDEDLYDSVIIDFQKATKLALDHLLTRGYNHIGYIGGLEKEHQVDRSYKIEDERLTTFEFILKEKGLLKKKDIYIGEYTMESGYALMKEALTNKLPQAFFVASDSMAIGALKALKESNISVPEEVAIVSFNDIHIAKFSSPPLTTVKVFTEEMGETGVNMLLDRLNGRQLPIKAVLPTKLVIRESC
ncbi:LacI family DNA-binding transcriptional regulator [Bacillus sp. E214]|uniref:LacI family DNA-binding transcriptional regulator n=1 Tax=Bacillus sp. E214 TaxID=2587156 RepID=UPI0011DF7909|nr:LacI family DNA-binding transcriptional regulator [Bacillus sp. E214]